MTVFFIGWELWQEMSFVLACCIVLVFFVGLGKLWWTNRVLRRLEIIDEEKRARVSTLSHCGLDVWQPPEIPFGVRAIQNGIEVEGIWISRPNTPDISQMASTTLLGATTLIGDQTDLSKGKERMTEMGSVSRQQTLAVCNSPDTRRTHTLSPSTSPVTVSASEPSLQPEPPDEKTNIYLAVPQSGSYVRRLRDARQQSGVSSLVASGDPSTSSGPATSTCWSNQGLEAVSSSNTSISESALYRSAEVTINRNTRRPNRGCAIFPAVSRPDCHQPRVRSLDGQRNISQQRISDSGSSSKSELVQPKLRRTLASNKRGGVLSGARTTR